MTKEWENVLGQMVLFTQEPSKGWQFETHDLDVRQDASVWYASQQAARLAVASMIYAFFVMEEVTSQTVQSSVNTTPAASPRVGPSVSPPSARSGRP